MSDFKVPKGKYLIRDRFDHQEYLMDQSTYQYIIDLIDFYHQSTYEFPDWDQVHVKKIEDQENQDCKVSINRLIFE
ncbi:MAG: hypothetical protein ACFHWX_21545 [Bacteroidota bacterium]